MDFVFLKKKEKNLFLNVEERRKKETKNVFIVSFRKEKSQK